KGKNSLDAVQLKSFLSGPLPGYMIPAFFVLLERLPLTPTGKLDRGALPSPSIGGGKEYSPPRDAVETQLVEIWADVLGIEKEQIGIDDNFFQLGGHSLKATRLLLKLNKAFNIKLTLGELFQWPVISRLAIAVKEAALVEHFSVEPVEKKEYYPLSPAQEQLVFIRESDETGTAYNISAQFMLEGHVDKARFEEAFNRLVKRHESLRTSFFRLNDQTLQRILDTVEFETPYEERPIPAGGLGPIVNNFIRPFDLSSAPLFRTRLVKFEPGKYLLMIDMHHIISDGTSIGVMVKDFTALVEGKQLPLPRIQYKDFSLWQTGQAHRETLKQQETHWLPEFQGDIPLLDLPIDHFEPVDGGFNGRRVRFELDGENTQALNDYALRRGMSLYMVLFSLYNVFLARISGQDDIVTGTPVAGRGHPDLESVIGMFVNTLPLRNYPSGQKTLALFMEEVKTKTLTAFENQDYPYHQLVKNLGRKVSRSGGQNPLFRTMMLLQNVDIPRIRIPGLTLEPHVPEEFIVKFDLSLEGIEDHGVLRFFFDYNTRLFKHRTVERFVTRYKQIVSAFIRDPQQEISALEIITEGEKRQILEEFNAPPVEFPRDKTIHRLFEEQVERTPHRVAVSDIGNMFITYRELDQRSRQLARLLRTKGVATETIVGIVMERSIQLPVAVLGTLKAGAAYLPIDPEYPEERIDFMLRDSGARVIVTNGLMVKRFNGSSQPTNKPINQHTNKPTHLAYIIYTSGSTGRPKGVMVEHRNVTAYIDAFHRELDLSPRDVYLQQTSVSFDVFAEEFFSILLTGGRLAITPKEVTVDPDRLSTFILERDVTIVSCSPLLLNQFRQFATIGSIRILVAGGDVLKQDYVGDLVKRARVYNSYGPTETTIGATLYPCSPQDPVNPPIGKPMPNYLLYILDKTNRLQPIGIPGELYIAGAGVSRGYLNRPQLTREKFEKRKFELPSTLYRTGDLARWLPDGNIEFLGRIDHQVKIRGFRIELGEIESLLLKHPDIREAVVVSPVNQKKERYLAAYIVVHKHIAASQIKEFLSLQLPGYMVPAYFVPIGKIPFNSNGKIDIKALPEPAIDVSDGSYTPPQNEIQARLVNLWAELLDVEKDQLGIDANFFEVGGHSIIANVLVSGIHKLFNVKIALFQFLNLPTIRALAELIAQSEKAEFIDLEKIEEREFYPLSFNQERLWFLHRLEPSGSSFNMPGHIPLEGPVEENHIRETLARLFERHESFRTRFKEVDKVPVQFIVEEVEIPFRFIDISGLEEVERERERERIYKNVAQTPFDLEQPPVFRSLLVKVTEDRFEFIYNKHHIISDGWSAAILAREFMQIYDGYRTRNPNQTHLQPLELQYKDFCYWQNRQLTDPQLTKESRAWWRNKMETAFSTLQAPGDPGKYDGDFSGAGWRFFIDQHLREELDQLSYSFNTSLFTVLFAVYMLSLHRFDNRERVFCSIISAGRGHISLKNIMGFFVNAIPFEIQVNLKESFNDFLHRVKADTLEAFRHQGYPVEKVADQLNTRYPAIPFSFNMVNIGDTGQLKEIPDFEPRHIEESQDVKFDLETYFDQCVNGIEMFWAYKIRAFQPDVVNYMAGEYIRMLEFFVKNPHDSCKSYKKRLKKKNIW
ncbi:MAG: amino acid adenylation domain-containing protein, partial [bacterium]|nr:amino acid adenylation domain-containing protein [bacterium]